MELDYDLLDVNTENSTAAPEESKNDAVESPVQSEPESTPSGKQTVQEPVTEDDFDDATPLTPREKILMERLDRITGENLSLSVPKRTEISPVITPSDRNFLENLDLDDVLGNAEDLNKLLLSVRDAVMEESSKLTAERILQNLPSIMSQYVTNHMSMAKLAENFYAENPDLVSSSQTVASIANKIAAEHPEYTAEQVFDASAIEARKVLRLKATAPVTEPVKTTKPAFAPPG
jgi:uncharacterized phage infection (PIP) family protein YhgE